MASWSSKEPDRLMVYDGGIDLLTMAGEISGRIAVESKYGVIHLGATVVAIRGSAGASLDLTPDEADELSGALSRAAEAAREARAQELELEANP